MSYISQRDMQDLEERVTKLEDAIHDIVTIGTMVFCMLCIGIIYSIVR